MKRAITLTLTVALIGSLMAMGFAGTVAAQNDDGLNIDIDIPDTEFDDQESEQTTGDANANTYVNVDQNNDNSQEGAAYAEASALSVSDGNNGGAQAESQDDKYKDHGADTLSTTAADGSTSAIAAADTTLNQVQDVDQTNAAEVNDVTTIAESGDNELEQEQGVEVDLEFEALDGE